MIERSFWQGKKVFVTGHTGFKGSWLTLWLKELGALVKGYSLEPPTQPNLFQVANIARGMESEIADIRNSNQLFESIRSFAPDIIIHMAAQPLVRLSYENPVETYETNVMGTVHLLDAVRRIGGVKAIVNVTSDKCYENREWVWGYREEEAMGGYDPYSNSKGCAELVTASFRKSYFNLDDYSEHGCAIATVRAGNVIGGGDWALDRLVPDILKSMESNQDVVIRNPEAIRPWQYVLEPLSGYLMLAEKLYTDGPEYAEGWNFGPREEDAMSVKWIVGQLVKQWGDGANWCEDKSQQPHEAHYLKLDCSKARMKLHWQAAVRLEDTLTQIVSWQKAWLSGEDMEAYSCDELNAYIVKRNRLLG